MEQDNMYIFNLIIQKRILLLRSIFYELKSQYAGSFLGFLWILIGPLALISIYTFIYLYVLKVKPEAFSTESYVLYLISGLLPYIGFTQSIQKASSSILQNKAAIFNTLYPIEFIPIRALIASFIPIIIGIILLLFYKILSGHLFFGLFGIFLCILNLIFFTLGVVFVTSLVIIGFRDLENILQYFFMILLFVTPIGFLVENLPTKFKFIVYLNPLYHLISPFQKIIAFNQPYTLWTGIYTLLLSIFMFYLGSRFFRSFKMTIFELL